MIEDELGVMAKRIASMAEDRCSDHAVGAAVLLLAEMAMDAVIKQQIDGLSPAKRMDLESGVVDGMEWSAEDKQTFVDTLADPPAPSERLRHAADERYGRR